MFLIQHAQNKEMRSIQTISAKCVRTSLDKTAVMNQQETFEGTAKYMKPNLAMLEMRFIFPDSLPYWI